MGFLQNKNRISLFLSLLAAAVTSAYSLRVLQPWDHQWGEKHDGIKSQMGDLYAPWVGTRELLLHRRNPYGPEVSHEIQNVFYGHPVDQSYDGRQASIVNEQRFAYPVYLVLVLAPAGYADFASVRRWAWIVLALLVASAVWLCVDLLHLHLPWEGVTASILFILSSPQIAQGLRFEQLALLVGFLLIAGAWCVSKHRFILAGALLAMSTIKPQMSLLPLCWFAIWTLGDWRNRRKLALSFTAALMALFLAGEFLLPGWFEYFFAGVSAYRRYAPTSSLLRVALGDALGEIVGGIVVLAVLPFGWHKRACGANSSQFNNTFAAFLMAALLAFPLFTPYNQVLLILPAMLLIQDWNRLPRFPKFVFAVSVIWPWITSFVLLQFLHDSRSLTQVSLLPNFLVVFFPLLFPLLLMARRSGVVSKQSVVVSV